VLRRLLRRAVRHAWQLGAERPVTPALVDATVRVLGDAYPVLRSARDGIVEMAEREEVRFRRTLDSGHTLLESQLEEVPHGGILEGETAFRLHDTYGFPVELVEEIASERGITVDRVAFDREMEAQRARARAARASTSADGPAVYRQIFDASGPTRFLGYEETETRATVLAVVADGEPIDTADTGREVEVFFDTTTFYGESGGQVGDTGTATTDTGELEVVDTQHAVPGLHGHRAIVRRGTVRVGQDALLAVDAGRRERIRKSHTGTHVLHWALRSVVGQHVQQAGSLVEAGRLRFDFSHHAALEDDVVAEVERVANERVIENARVRVYQVARQEAEELGALAFFGDKYGEVVRVVEAGSYSRELCGGTHVPSTGQIGPLVVVGESSIGSNLRRIEAYTGSSGYAYLSGLRRQLETAASHLRTRPDQVGEAAAALVARTKAQEDRLEAFEAGSRSVEATRLVESAEVHGGNRLVVAGREGLQPDELRQLAMQIRDRLGSGVVVVGSARAGKAGVVVAVTPELARSGVSAAEIAGAAAAVLGGGASRDPELSQAGGPHGDRIGDALEEAGRIATEALGG